MTDQLTIDIIEIKRSWKVLIARYGYPTAGLLLFVVVFLFDSKALILGAVVILWTVGIFRLAVREHNITGTLLLDANSISFDTNRFSKSYLLDGTQRIKITYSGYDGRPPNSIKNIVLSKGIDNYFTIYTDEAKRRLRVLINEKDIMPLNYLIDDWRKKRIDVSITNTIGIRIKRLSI